MILFTSFRYECQCCQKNNKFYVIKAYSRIASSISPNLSNSWLGGLYDVLQIENYMKQYHLDSYQSNFVLLHSHNTNASFVTYKLPRKTIKISMLNRQRCNFFSSFLCFMLILDTNMDNPLKVQCITANAFFFLTSRNGLFGM